MRKVALGALVLLTSAFGCTAILGDFEVASGVGPGGTDGSTDGTSTDGDTDGSASDGGDAGDASDGSIGNTVYSVCNVSMSNPPRVVAQVDDAGVGFHGELRLFRINATTLRVVTQKAFTGEGATVYTFDPNKNGQNGPITPDVLDLQNSGRYFDARRLPNQGVVSLLFMEKLQAAPKVHMKVIELPDNNPLGQQSFNMSTDFDDTLGSGGGNVSGALGAYQNNNEYFWAVGGWPSPTGGPVGYNLIVGHRVSAANLPTPVTVHTTTDDRETRIRDMARSKDVQYIFNDKGPDDPNEPGTSYYKVPQDTTVAIPPKTLKPTTGTKPYVMIGASGISTGDGIRIATAEVDFTNSNNFGVVKAGIVSQADLDKGFDGTMVPTAFTLSSLTDVPSESSADFFTDDLIWLGSPPDPLKGQGLNFIWFNTQSRVMRSKQTGMQRMLLGENQIIRSAVVLTSQSPVNAELDMVFTKTTAGGSAALMYAKISCIK